MAIKRRGRGESGSLRQSIERMRDSVKWSAYQANFYKAIGDNETAQDYFDQLKKVFQHADQPRYAAEDVRHDLQVIAAKERKRALVTARRHIAARRRQRVADKRRNTSKHIPIKAL